MGTNIAKKTIIILVVCVMASSIFFILVVPLSKFASKPDNVMNTIFVVQWRLSLGRDAIKDFNVNMGRYPNSLVELEKYIQKKPEFSENFKLCNDKFIENISDKNGNSKEYNTLNGLGGFYYNSKTGELKVNLIKPIKKYYRFYFRTHRNEIPAEW